MKTPITPQRQRQRPRRAVQAASVVEILVIVVVVVVLAGFLFPFGFSPGARVQVKGAQTKALAQAKQIGLALKLYADDNNGAYPDGTNAYGETIRTSNDAFRSLFPKYTQSESIFGNKLSAWQASGPDNLITNLPEGQTLKPGEQSETLKPGENVYAYVAGLNDGTANPQWPLIADGTDGTGHYTTQQNARGGVWKGTRAVVIRVDNSGALENLTGPENARYIARSKDSTENLLDVAAYPEVKAVGLKTRLLDPAALHVPKK